MLILQFVQDTNITQYELMRCFAKAHGGVSVVGDPDQSIYGWRSAEVENLNKMTQGKHTLIWWDRTLAETRQTSVTSKLSTWKKTIGRPDLSCRPLIPSSLKVTSAFVLPPKRPLTEVQTASESPRISSLPIRKVPRSLSKPSAHLSSKRAISQLRSSDS